MFCPCSLVPLWVFFPPLKYFLLDFFGWIFWSVALVIASYFLSHRKIPNCSQTSFKAKSIKCFWGRFSSKWKWYKINGPFSDRGGAMGPLRRARETRRDPWWTWQVQWCCGRQDWNSESYRGVRLLTHRGSHQQGKELTLFHLSRWNKNYDRWKKGGTWTKHKLQCQSS